MKCHQLNLFRRVVVEIDPKLESFLKRRGILSQFRINCESKFEDFYRVRNGYLQGNEDLQVYHATGISSSFRWDSTPEGLLFWNKYDEIWRKYYK